MSTQTSIITQHNILNPHDRMVLTTLATHSSEVLNDLLIADGFEVTLYKNSELQLEPFDIKQGDIINVVFIPMGGGGGGKSIISLVAVIALSVATVGWGAAAAGAMGFTGTALTIAGAVMQAGIMVAGALLINSVIGTSSPSLSTNDNLSTSTTYSWDESYNKFQQGLSIPKVFGTHKITPPLISKYIETIDNKQYFNGLYAVNDGSINSITDIKINDESIDNFDNVNYEVRYGYNNQLVINNFNNTKSDKNVSRKLSTDYVETNTNGNAVISLTANLVFPRGLFYANDSGQITPYSVKVVLEYSADGITWKRFGGDTYTVGNWYKVVQGNGVTNIALYSSYQGTYLGMVSSLPSNTVYNNSYNERWINVSWYYEAFYSPYVTITGSETSTIRKTFKVNNLPPAQYQIRAKFYEAPISGSRYGSDCYLEYITEEIGDDFTYPSTALISIRALATDQLSGGNPKISCIVTANSNNPALICKQMLTESGIDSVRILSSFDEWETHCNNMGYAFNGVIDTSMTLRKALDLVSTAGRGSVIQFGSKFEVIMDRAETIPVQSFMFGMGNILKDSFSQSFLPILDRANVIEATYYDAYLDYEPTIVEVSNNNYDSVAEENRTSVTLVGFTNRQQAIKHCRYLLNCNRYLTETVSIEADKDSLVCKYGDIVRVSHDVPQYGFSGRIEACTTTSITLDREINITYGVSYYVQIRDINNNVYEHPVHWKATGDYDTFDFVTPISTPYSQYDNYAFGELGKASKLFRVLRISTASDMTRKLELLEYNEDVYNDSGDIDVPLISAFGLSNLRATDYIRYAKDGSIETVMQLAWSGQSISYNVSYKKATQSAYNSILSHDCFIDLIVDDTLYDIIITDTYGQSVATQYQVIGKSAKPNSVTNLTAIESGNTFSLNWDYEHDVDFKEFVILLNDVEIGRTRVDSFICFSAGLDTKKFTVVTQDTSGNKSDYINVFITALAPNQITNLTCTESGNVFALSWNYLGDNDFKEFIVTLGGIEIGRTTTNQFSTFSAGLTTKVFSVTVVDTSGNNSDYVSVSITAKPPRNVTNLTAIESGNVFSLNWDYDSDVDFKEFVILLNNVEIGRTRVDSFSYFSLGLDTKKFTVVTQDTSGNNSDYINVFITAKPPRNVTNFKVDNAFNIQKILSWDYNKEEDFKSFEIRMGQGSSSTWNNATPIHNGIITQSPFVWDYAGYKEFTLFIKAIDNGGNYSVTADRILFNVGTMNFDNILETVCMQPTWEGTLTNGNIINNKIVTLTDTTNMYYQNSMYEGGSFYDGGLVYTENNFYSGESSNYIYGRKIPILTYIFNTSFNAGGNIKFNYDIDGDLKLEYVLIGGNLLYSDNYSPKYDGGNMYDDYSNFTEYNKPFAILDNTVIKWKLSSTGGALEMSQFCGICDVPDIYDTINDKTIPIGGIQVIPNVSFHEIQNVLVTLQGQGIPRVTSKAPSGATIQVFNASNVDIGGIADIQYKGF